MSLCNIVTCWYHVLWKVCLSAKVWWYFRYFGQLFRPIQYCMSTKQVASKSKGILVRSVFRRASIIVYQWSASTWNILSVSYLWYLTTSSISKIWAFSAKLYRSFFYKRKLFEGGTVTAYGWDLKRLALKAYPDQLIHDLQPLIIKQFIYGLGIKGFVSLSSKHTWSYRDCYRKENFQCLSYLFATRKFYYSTW